jgi:hypothetical protein
MGQIAQFAKRYVYDIGYDIENEYYYRWFLKKKQGALNKECGIKPDSDFDRRVRAYYARISNGTFHIDTRWHDYYAGENGIYDVRYIPENLFNGRIEPYYNRKSFAKAWADKCFYEMHLDTSLFRMPVNYVRNVAGVYLDRDFQLISKKQAVQICMGKKFIIKDSLEGKGGNDIEFSDGNLSGEQIDQMFLKYGENFVVSEILVQDGPLHAVNPTSVNTIRMMSMLLEDRVEILSCVLRIGGTGARVDNFSQGGIVCGITPDGITKNYAWDHLGNRYEECHPNGNKFSGIKIPNFEEAKEVVKRQHMRLPYFKLISWDLMLNGNEVGFIEFNLSPQGTKIHQLANGPLFGDLTDRVLKDGFKKKWKRSCQK